MTTPRPRPLTLAALCTTALLLLAAALATLGVFDDALGWDIFAPSVEAALRGVFVACLVLAAFGVAITLVLGIHSVAAAMRVIAADRPAPAERAPRVPLRRILRPLGLGTGGLLAAVLSMSMFDWAVTLHRDDVFDQLVGDQLEHLGPRVADRSAELPRVMGQEPPAAPELAELLQSLESLPFILDAQLYLAAPGDEPALWRFDFDAHHRRWRQDVSFAVLAPQRAMLDALRGEPAALRTLDEQQRFVAYPVVHDEHGHPIAIVWIRGNPRESLRGEQLRS